MDEFYQTCAITQTPIKDGDEVVGILLAEVSPRMPSRGLASPGEVWNVIAAPLLGNFSTDALITNVDNDWNLDYIVNSIRETIIEQEEFIACECCYIYDPKRDYDYSNLTWDEIKVNLIDGTLQLMMDRHVQVVNKETGAYEGIQMRSVPTNVTMAFVHRAVWDGIISQEITFEDVSWTADKLAADALAFLNTVPLPVDDFFAETKILMLPMIRAVSETPMTILSNYFFKEIPNASTQEIVNRFCEMAIINIAMQETRRFWHPQLGIENIGINIKLHETINTLAANTLLKFH